jgi:hypothetical protein
MALGAPKAAVQAWTRHQQRPLIDGPARDVCGGVLAISIRPEEPAPLRLPLR